MITPPARLRDADGVHHLFPDCSDAHGLVTAVESSQKVQRRCCTRCLLRAGSTVRRHQPVPA